MTPSNTSLAMMRRKRRSANIGLQRLSTESQNSTANTTPLAQEEPAGPPTPLSSMMNNYVWIRTEMAEAILDNGGSLPKDWKPSRKRGRDATHWGWTRARILSSQKQIKSRSSRNPYQSRNGGSTTSGRSITVTLAIEDDEFAPTKIQGKTVSVSYDSNDNDCICNANTWWNTDAPPPEDLTSLTHLHEPAVVFCLQKHYQQNSIYTYTGKILLALNPFQMIDNIYGEDVMKTYWDGDEAGNQKERERPPPHAYAIAQDAYRSLLHEGDDQSILVSGESGSGKTVTTKIIMGYLASQSQRYALENHHEGIESQILQSNPILESFGNARTVRNDNSSRFGKFIELLFSPSTGQLISASIETYLLEKVRLISQAPGERNYHVFYELLGGLSATEERQALKLESVSGPEDFRMTALSETFDRRDGVDDADTFRDLREALRSVGGFTEAQQMELFSVTCALLHTSNVDFQEDCSKGEDGSALVDSTSLQDALQLLGVSKEGLYNALCMRKIEARGEVFHKQLSVVQAIKALEALIKATYGSLFAHIVGTINKSIAAKLEAMNLSRVKDLPRIGVLDIFGFESFDVNSYEQLCINYCNEALQQQFNKFVFKLEQREYKQEGIDWSFIEFPDNQDILDLIEKKRDGILSILDENCRLATCTDTTFCQAIYEKCKHHSRFSASQAQKASLSFSIEHYAGTVTYNSENFLEKNKDELPKETTDLLTSSTVPFLAYLGETLKIQESESGSVSDGSPNKRTPGGTNGRQTNNRRRNNNSSIRRNTVGNQFSNQLRQLRDRIDSTTPHYVRCLKPNDDLVPNQFEAHIIAEQLCCAGVLEAIRVSRVGFPHRYYHEQFIQRYGILTKKTNRHKKGNEVCSILKTMLVPQVSAMLSKQGNSAETVSLGMQVGFTKVFLRTTIFDSLEYLRNKKLAISAIVIQKHHRRYVAQNRFLVYRFAALTIQCFVRRVGAYLETRRILEGAAAIRIQSCWRTFLAETELMASRLIADFGQKYWRGVAARKLFAIMNMENQAKLVQRCWRGYRVRRPYRQTLRFIVIIQCCWRRKIARRVLRECRREARSIGAIAAERDRFKEELVRLRKEVESLRASKGDSGQNRGGSAEVERLRREVQRLQTVLSQTQGSTSTPQSVAGNSETFGFHESTGILWPDNGSVYETGSTFTSHSLPRSICAPSRSSSIRNLTANIMSPSRSIGFGQASSSPSTSLLDMDPEQGIEDYQLRNVSDSVSSPARIFHASLTHCIRGDGNDDDDEYQHRLEERHNPTDVSAAGLPGTNEISRLHNFIKNDDKFGMFEMINNSNDPLMLVNAQNQDGQTSLHIAVISDNLDAIIALLEKGVVTNTQDIAGNTALHLSNSSEVVKLLLEEGNANPNIPNIDGICVLHKRVQSFDVESVRLLLQHNAKVDVADHTNWVSPIHIAVLPATQSETDEKESSRFTIVKLLCDDLDYDMNEKDRKGNGPLHYCSRLETSDAAQVMGVILERGADPKLSNARNQQALLLLCHNQKLRQNYDVFQQCVHLLLHYGADPNYQSNTGCTPLHLSLYHQDIDSAIQLINRSAELHMLWKRPKSWIQDGDRLEDPHVLALDMVSQTTSIHRLLASITLPPKPAPQRPWCMECKASQRLPRIMLHCQHCGRHICSNCAKHKLSRDFFPKSFDVHKSSWVCLVCEDILVSRKEDFSNSTSTTHPMSSLVIDDDEVSSSGLHII